MIVNTGTLHIYKGAVLTSATVPWHGLIFCLEASKHCLQASFSDCRSKSLEASEVALAVFTADRRPCVY